MKILLIHQNFPGQFKHLAPALSSSPGNEVVTLTMKKGLPDEWHNIRVRRYGVRRGSTKGIHPWVSDFETKTIRGEACYYAALKLRDEGFYPDVIIAHPGWGESLFLKEVWPRARLGIYCEFFYLPRGADTGFDPEFSADERGSPCRIRLKNVNNIMHFDLADAGISPTHWQASTFPEPFRSKISVIHDGIDTAKLKPAKGLQMKVNNSLTLGSGDEIITFVNRDFEPMRGYHTFMRALPEILAGKPGARVFLVGGDGVSYGAKNKAGKTWKQHFIDEVRPRIPAEDWRRVHFVGKLAYEQFVRLLQLSSVHVYLTYPFVLSWSLLEAMSIGCAVVASDTAPLHEAIEHGETGRLVDFFDPSALAGEVIRLLDNPEEREILGKNARNFAVAHYDLETCCLPAQMKWVENLARDAG